MSNIIIITIIIIINDTYKTFISHLTVQEYKIHVYNCQLWKTEKSSTFLFIIMNNKLCLIYEYNKFYYY